MEVLRNAGCQWEKEQALAIRAVTQAAEVLSEDSFERSLEYRVKESARDIVTEFDEKIENQIRDVLAPHGAPVVGEETFSRERNFKDYQGEFWCVDPIDGTVNLVKGLPFFGTSVALVSKSGKQLTFPVGAIYAHQMRELYFTSSSRAYLNGRPIRRMSESADKSVFGICLGAKPFAERTLEIATHLNAKTLGFLRLGSASIVLSNVVTGKLCGAFGFGVKLWDIAGGLALASAVGCKIWVSEIIDEEYRVSFVVGSDDFVEMVKSEMNEGRVLS